MVFAHENSREIASFSRDIAQHYDLAQANGARVKRTGRIGPLCMYVYTNERMVVGVQSESDAVRRASCEIYAYNRAIIRFRVHLTISTYE